MDKYQCKGNSSHAPISKCVHGDPITNLPSVTVASASSLPRDGDGLVIYCHWVLPR